jgi:hypothetical protein
MHEMHCDIITPVGKDNVYCSILLVRKQLWIVAEVDNNALEYVL